MDAKLIAGLRDATLAGRIEQVTVGLTRTAVLAETEKGLTCGLAATLTNPELGQHGFPVVDHAGGLDRMPARDLMGLLSSNRFVEVGIGLATVNALLPAQTERWVDLKAEAYLYEHAPDSCIAVIGHFPFVSKLKPLARECWVLELNPVEGDLPATAAQEILPRADFLAITATTLINGTFKGLMELRKPGSRVMLLGPSTPLTTVLFDHGVDLLSGSVVTDIERLMLGVRQAATVHQLRASGAIRMVTLSRL